MIAWEASFVVVGIPDVKVGERRGRIKRPLIQISSQGNVTPSAGMPSELQVMMKGPATR